MSQNILVVEDHRTMSDLYQAMLKRCAPDARVTVAETYPEALASLAEPETSYDLVIMDLKLPRAPWPELLGVQEIVQQSQAPVMVCTGMDPRLEHEALQVGATMFFFKPALHYATFAAAVQRLLTAPPPPLQVPPDPPAEA